jgi:hypothetical protein
MKLKKESQLEKKFELTELTHQTRGSGHEP